MGQFLNDLRDHRAFVLAFAPLAALALAIGVGAPFAIQYAGDHVPAVGALLRSISIAFDPKIIYLPLGMVFVTVASLGIEAIGLGYRDSTIHRILTNASPSVRTDLFYFLLRVSGLTAVLAFLVSFGTFGLLVAWIEQRVDLRVLQQIENPLLQFVAVALAQSLSFYAFHRLMHTKLLWEVHKVHHSAEDYNVLLPYRNHPIDFLGATLLSALFAAVLGAGAGVVIAWSVVNGFYQSLVHSRLQWKWTWLNYVLITPAAHRVHHSTSPAHFNRNYGILTLWDWLFRTYHPPQDEPIAIGVADRDNFNTDRHFSEMGLVVLRWLGLAKAGRG